MKRVVITPSNTESNYWKDLRSYRGLFFYLAWRDVVVRYKQTVIGVAWAVVRPALTIAVFWFLGWILGVPAEGAPRIVLVTAATLPWQFFASAFGDASNSLIANANLLTKVYFPRILIPASTLLVCLVDFFISLSLLVIVMLVVGHPPQWKMLMFPLFLGLAAIAAFGAGLWLAALNVKYRDFRYIVPFIVQFGLYVSPVAFSSDLIYGHEGVPAWCKYLYACNPMVGVIDGFRWCVADQDFNFQLQPFFISCAASVLMLFGGFWYFRKTERSFADFI
ncbi:MAG: ABC transporter permease [Flavobacteriales bacterium]|nr:ABC transporter permease [Flavobacteriales bacterium]